jgi:hypothetical protein
MQNWCFSTAKILIRTRLNIKFYVHHRSCVNFRSVLTKDYQVSTAQWSWHFRVVPYIDHIIKSTVLPSLWKQWCSFPKNNFYNYLGTYFWYCINISHYGNLFSSSKVLPSRLSIATPGTRVSRVVGYAFYLFIICRTKCFILESVLLP